MVGHSKENPHRIMRIIGIWAAKTTGEREFPLNIFVDEVKSFLIVTSPLRRSTKESRLALTLTAIFPMAVVDLTACPAPDLNNGQIVNGHILHCHCSKS